MSLLTKLWSMMVHDGINNCNSYKYILRNYNHALEGVYEHHQMTMDVIEKQLGVILPQKIPATPLVRINNKNIHNIEKAIFETYKISDNKNNPYQILRDAECWGLLHDATTQYVKEVNTIFVREIS